MYDFYHTPVSSDKDKRARRALKNLYSSIPDTEGCQSNIEKGESGCGAWCCSIQSPQVMFAEFMQTWSYVKDNWDIVDIRKIIIKAISVYLDGKITKGCVFWDRNTKYCLQHKTRAFNCRIYAQIPDEDFKPRFERLKVIYQDEPNAQFRYQCNLVTSVGKPPTVDDINEWFRELNYIEKDFGIPEHLINDGPGGSYRTYHDHIILHLGSDIFLSRISRLREKGSKDEIKAFIDRYTAILDKIDEIDDIKL